MRKKNLLFSMMATLTLLLLNGCETPETPPEQITPEVTEIKVSVDEVLYDSITVTVTPPDDNTFYFAYLYSDDSWTLINDDKTLQTGIIYSSNFENLLHTGTQTLQFEGLIGDSHYRLIFFEYNDVGKPGPLLRSDRITTPTGPSSFDITIENISGVSADITITPDSEVDTYYYFLDTKDDWLSYHEDSNHLLIQNDFAFWQFCGSLYEDTSWLDFLEASLVSGKQEISSDAISYYLRWNTEYFVYAYGLDKDGNITTQVTKEFFKTAPRSANVDMTFQTEILPLVWDEEYRRWKCEAKITPSSSEYKFFTTITQCEWYDWYFSEYNTEEPTDEDYIQHQILLNWDVGSKDMWDNWLYQGESVYSTVDIRGHYLRPSADYYLFVFGMDENGPITPLHIHKFTTGASPN